MGEVIKSGVVATFPLQGEVQSQPKGEEGRWHASHTPPPPPILPLSLHQVPHPVPGESGAGWGPGLSTPASGLRAQGEVTWLAYTMALSQFQPRLLQRWALPVPLQALPVLGVSCTNCPPSKWVLKRELSRWSPVSLYKCLWVAFLGIAQCVCWLLCAELRGSGVSLNHRDGRYIYVSTLQWSPEPLELRRPALLDKVTESALSLNNTLLISSKCLTILPFSLILHFFKDV